jgi:deazaflavin-dependent oxidoreductase (nitroreductase family)
VTNVSAADHPNNALGVPMIVPPWLERLQINYVNPVVRPIARYLPGLSVITHRGRTSGKPYQTIVTAYRKGNLLAIALAHGKTNWVKNVLAAGQAEVRFTRRTVHITNPRILLAGSDAEGLPWPARLQARRIGIFVADIT